MRILLTGGTGTISYGLAKEAIRRGHEVTIVNRGNRKFRIIDNAECITADVNDLESLKKIITCREFDIVIDSLVYDLNSLKRSISVFESHCARYVFISSCCSFGNAKDSNAITEQSEHNPNSQYGKKKFDCEEYLIKQKHLFDYTIIRPYITYGDIRIPIPFACRRNPYTVIERIRENKPLVCFEHLGNHATYHNLMHVDDFSKIVISLLEREESRNTDYNVCGGRVYSWDDAYTLLYHNLASEKHLYEIQQKYFKYIDNHLYEDIKFDKDCKGTIYSSERISPICDLIDEKNLSEGIQETIAYLDKYLSTEPIEEEFNIRTDMLLLFAVKKKDAYLKQYIREMSITYKTKLTYHWMLRLIKYSIKNVIK